MVALLHKGMQLYFPNVGENLLLREHFLLELAFKLLGALNDL
jgi:hypothetical protein